MFNVDTRAIQQFQNYLKALPAEQTNAFVRQGYTEAVMQAAEAGDVDFINRLEATARGGQGRIALKEKGTKETPENIPTVIRIARDMAKQTGRAPRIYMRIAEPLPGVRAWTEALLVERKG